MSPRVHPLVALLAILLACGGDDAQKGPDDTAVAPPGPDGETGEETGEVEGPDPYDVEVGPYDAAVRWTEYGLSLIHI